MEGIAGVLWGNLSNCTYLGIGNFFPCTIFFGRGHNMVRVQKWLLFFEPKISVFGPQIRILPYDPNFVDGPVFTLIVLIIIGKRTFEPGRGWDKNFSTFGCKTYYSPSLDIFIIGNICVVVTKKNIYECLSEYSSFQAGKRRPLSICSILVITDQD